MTIVACQYPLDVFSNMSVELSVSVHRAALMLFSPSTSIVGDMFLMRESLYGLLHFCCHGSLVAPPLAAETAATVAPPAPAAAVTAATAAATTVIAVDADSGEDNVEDAVKPADVEELYMSSGMHSVRMCICVYEYVHVYMYVCIYE